VAPYAGVTIVYLVVRRVVLSGFAVNNYPRPLSWVVLSGPSALWFYLRQLCWPFRVSAFYDFDLTRSFSYTAFVLPLLFATLALGALAYLGREKRLGLLSAVWILAALLPVIAGMKVFPWHDYVHDRYLYLPSAMVALLAAVALKHWAARLGAVTGNTRRIQFALTALLAMVFGLSTLMQSRQWESDLALFSRAHDFAPANPVPADYLARTLYGQERSDEALAIYRGLLKADPNYWQANYVLGLASYQMGRYDEAEKYLNIATHVWPSQFLRPEPVQFYYLGLVQQRKGEYVEAEASLRRAVDLYPDAVGYHNALGTVLQKSGREAEAQEQFRLEGENRKVFAARQKEFPDAD
jgi:tetratricopeptide (TPR) repeat protein